MAARKGCRVGQKMTYRFSFSQLYSACTRRSIYFNVSELLSKKKYPLFSKLNDSGFCYVMAVMFEPLRPETQNTSTPGGRQSFSPIKFQKRRGAKDCLPPGLEVILVFEQSLSMA